MQRDLQIIGDRIEFMGYHVGTLTDITPPTIRGKFEELLCPEKLAPIYYGAVSPASRRKGKRK